MAAVCAAATALCGQPAAAAWQTATVAQDANLRAAPTTSSAVLDERAAGERVEVACWTADYGAPPAPLGDGPNGNGNGNRLGIEAVPGRVVGDVGAFPDCQAAIRAKAAPVLADEPGYRDDLDADSDGIGCEYHPDWY